MHSVIDFTRKLVFLNQKEIIRGIKPIFKYYASREKRGHLEYDNETNADFLFTKDPYRRFCYRLIMTYENLCNSFNILIHVNNTVKSIHLAILDTYGPSVANAFFSTLDLSYMDERETLHIIRGMDAEVKDLNMKKVTDYRIPDFSVFVNRMIKDYPSNL